jgi:hypothetical protein
MEHPVARRHFSGAIAGGLARSWDLRVQILRVGFRDESYTAAQLIALVALRYAGAA